MSRSTRIRDYYTTAWIELKLRMKFLVFFILIIDIGELSK